MIWLVEMKAISQADIERFWKYVQVGEPDSCWEWQGGLSSSGYGEFTLQGKTQSAHVIAYIITHGLPTQKICVCRTCDTRRCVNPAHLFAGTQKDITQIAVKKGRHGLMACPEKAARGDNNGQRKHPEKTARGDRNGTHTHPECVLRGEALHQAKLTEAVVRIIRANYIPGTSYLRDMAKILNMSYTCIRLAAIGKTWKHVQ